MRHSRQSRLFATAGGILAIAVVAIHLGSIDRSRRVLVASQFSKADHVNNASRDFPADPDVLRKYLDEVGQSLTAVLADPNQEYALRERAALALADLKYSPALPVLQKNFWLTYFADGVWNEDHPEPCQAALRRFHSAALLSLVRMCHVPATTKSPPSPKLLLLSMERRREARAILQIDIMTAVDPMVKDRLESGALRLREIDQDSQEFRFITFGEKMPDPE